MTEEVMQYLLLNLKGCCDENLLFALTKDIAKRNGQKKKNGEWEILSGDS